MLKLFQRKPPPADDVISRDVSDAPTAPHPSWDGYVPASARAPEPPAVVLDGDGDDTDVEFLATLAAQVEMQQRKKPMSIEGERTRARLQVQTVTLKDEERLDVFRDMQQHTEKRPRSDSLPVQHVEMTDLIDDLHTLQAALRQRRAA